MGKFFAQFGVMPDHIWFVDKRIRGERITNYNLALNFAHRRYHKYYNAYKERKTEYQIAVMTAFDLALPRSFYTIGNIEDRVKLKMSVCNETLDTEINKTYQSIYEKAAQKVDNCYYKYLKRYYGKKDKKEILEMVMIEMSMRSKKWYNNLHR